MIQRLKFWLRRRREFWCQHYAFQSYNPFTDRVTFRFGRFGKVDEIDTMMRYRWLDIGTYPEWRDENAS